MELSHRRIDGTYLLEAGPQGARCERTEEPPEVVMDVRTLSSLYLGSGNLVMAAAAGRVEGSPADVERVDRLFSWPIPAWCPVGF